MNLFSIKLPLIQNNDPLLEIIIIEIKKIGESLKDNDIIVISEKVVATSQGRLVSLSVVKEISEEAKKWAKECDMDVRLV